MARWTGHPNDAHAGPRVPPDDFHENLIKGTTAERIVERLFVCHGYEVRPNGVESQFPDWVHDRAIEGCEAADKIRSAPDLIVKIPLPDGSRKRFFHVEVKYRWNGLIPTAKVERYKAYPNAILALVSPGKISANYIVCYLRGEPLVPISTISALRLEEDVVFHFEKIARKMFTFPPDQTRNATSDSPIRENAAMRTPKSPGVRAPLS